MSKKNNSPVSINYDLKIIEIENMITVQDLSHVIGPLADFERKQDGWPNINDLRWTVVVKNNNE